MQKLNEISVEAAREKIQSGTVRVLDIRDPDAFSAGHIAGSELMTEEAFTNFLATADKQTPVIVCCYHGRSSQAAAMYLQQAGFAEVYSLQGGYAAWA